MRKDSKNEVDLLVSKTTELENLLAASVSKFDLKTPDSKNTLVFLNNIESKISTFNIKTDEIVQIKNSISQLKSDIKNYRTNLDEKENENKKYIKENEESSRGLIKLTTSRTTSLGV